MASHRPKRKSGPKTFIGDEDANSRDTLPPLKRTRRSSPDLEMAQSISTVGRTRSRTTRNSTVETDAAENSIFSKGPSRAKKAKRTQREQEERQKKERETRGQQIEPLVESVETTGKAPYNELQQPSEILLEPSQRTITRENERPLPARTTLKQPFSNRKPKVQTFETPRRNTARLRRSPRLNAEILETTVKESTGYDKPLTVPLAAIEDTPLVRKRNKEMREANGHRRSSLGLRGRRASSLTNGFIAAPHPDVQPSDFFKHLDAQMIETHRMQQLLAWCSKCSLSEKRARGRDAQSNARAAARVIEEDILTDLTEKKLSVNWWEASDDAEDPKDAPKKPHPKNEDHKRKIAILERQLVELNRERQAWLDIAEKAPMKLSKPQKEFSFQPGDLDVALLRSHEASLIPNFEETDQSISNIQNVMSKSRGTIEFKVDQFSHGMHKAQQYSQYAKGVSESVLAKASSVLEVRQGATLKAAGTASLPLHEILKSISHLDRG
ncbi:hypothetical protein H072_764 [Dactylellina haptotyla CBS 200.50]|uniref:Kinetochore protein Mis13/DSN1 n=1 Tax=Dactylellina haptotyla (strain CBS 200.50) TaxID=1284197 RepID=S8C0G1_DACHA|nr:hypothetical protein H072_764 [Dactylellina haptotyla CBS 200.50]